MNEKQRNLSMVMDFYELTMSQVYFNHDMNLEHEAVFDLFYRKNPDDGGYAIFAGLQQVVDYIQNLHFSADDIAYLRSLGTFSEPYLTYLAQFRFTGDLYAQKEGSVVFPNEPLLRIKAKMIEAQLIETALLLAINHQTLIATKANRIVSAASGAQVIELGARRAHNFDAANYGARAAYIGGVHASATTFAGEHFNLPIVGTMAHSYVQSFPSEYEAFVAYAATFPDNTVLLLDTYNTIESGLVNAIRIAKEYLEPQGKRLKGVRIDSGDIAYLSKKIRKILNENNMEDCNIVASNAFDEYIIQSLIKQGAQIDVYGVGENLVTSKSSPVFGGVYKLAALVHSDGILPKIKISENIVKLTNPGYKNLWRIYDNDNRAIADLMSGVEETIDACQDLKICHPVNVWKHKTLKAGEYRLEPLLQPVFTRGTLVYEAPSLEAIRAHREASLASMWDEIKRFEYPQVYFVDLSESLLELKMKLINDHKQG
ncbi:MAG: nicotinate phosphoribosyltransferase [Erysipelotrichaceae bacterium]